MALEPGIELCLRCGARTPLPPEGGEPTHDCRPRPPRKWGKECPTCGAQPGTPCMQMPSGKEMTYPHADRMALVLTETAA